MNAPAPQPPLRQPHDRLFIAFPTPLQVRLEALALIQRFRTTGADVSWEREEKLHCTMKFLGDVARERLVPLTEALTAVGRTTSPLRVRYISPGYFGSRQTPRTVWLGIEDLQNGLTDLVSALESMLEPLGFKAEQRPFRPHVTLGRIRSPRNAGKLIATLETVTFNSDVYSVDGFMLMRSDLTPAGSVYSLQETIPLLGKEASVQ